MRRGDFVPPIVAKLYRAARGARREPGRTYPSFAAALRDCGDGYEDEDIPRVVLGKTRAYRDKLASAAPMSVAATDAYGLLSVAHLLPRATTRATKILDLGGACGAHYFTFKKFLGASVPLDWRVVETETMCRFGRELGNDELSFSADLGAAVSALGAPDLIYASCVLQYVERPYEMLERIVNTGARYLLFNRMAYTSKADDLVTVHRSMLSANGVGPLPPGFQDREVKYPHVFLSRPRVESFLGGYETVIEFDDRTGFFPVDGEPVSGGGVLLRAKGRGAS